MSLDDKFSSFSIKFYNLVENFFEKVASLFGYPANPGMPLLETISTEGSGRSQLFDSLPKRITNFPPIPYPENWFEVIFGTAPRIDSLPRYMYETKEEGFYNFYIENYKNIFFLPDWFSEFLQVQLNICLDISLLEIIREVLFVGLVFYSQLVVLRITLFWFISINPYTFPWSYLTAAVDWADDILLGIVPSILGVNLTSVIFLGALGAMADSLNHLVFTMPFLPSEAEETQLVINNELKNVLVFHYLPILWYKHPIPNDIREYWYYERPDISKYMQTAYKDLDLQVLPDQIIQEFNQRVLSMSKTNNLTEYLSTELLSKLNPYDFDLWVKSWSDNFNHF